MNNENTLRKINPLAEANPAIDHQAEKELEITATMLDIDQVDDKEIYENERLLATVNLIREVRYRLGLPRVHY